MPIFCSTVEYLFKMSPSSPGPATVAELTAFKIQVLSRPTAQHGEIIRLRATLDGTGTVRDRSPSSVRVIPRGAFPRRM
ncbi:MAG: hypothetical protein ACQSGP_21825 [Frankia sp.]